MWHILKICYILLFSPRSELNKIDMDHKIKQQRAIVHLELAGKHYYYGNLKALTDSWGKEDLGVSYSYLKNLNITEDNPYHNDKCIIRRGLLATSERRK